MRTLALGLALAVGLALYPGVAAQADTTAHVVAGDPGDETGFVAKINALRTEHGLAALEVSANLTAKARSWSAGMAGESRIWHSKLSDGITADWQKLGENVGMGGSVERLHAAFVASPRHYENLVDPAFGYVGIGIVMNGDTMYVSEEFMALMPPKAPTTTTTTPTRPAGGSAAPTPPPPPAAPKRPAPKPAPPKPAPPKPVPPKPAAAAAPGPVPPGPVAPGPVADPPAPAAPPVTSTVTPPVEPTRAPTLLLLSVLERLRTFDR